MIRRLRRLLIGVALLSAGLVAAVLLSARPGDRALFPASDGGTDILLVSNAYHAGLVIPVPLLADAASRKGYPALLQAAIRFRHYDWVEIGWGDAGFYRAPDTPSLPWGIAFDALTGRGSGSVLHVVGIEGNPETIYGAAHLVRLTVKPEGLDRMALLIDRSFALGADRQPEDLGPGRYGPSRFYRANGQFNLFRVCNHWVADLLDAAGIPTTPLLSFLPWGILADLKWRSGLPAG